MIKPTVGRVVWYHPARSDPGPLPGGGQPLAAIIAHVWSETCVNLTVFDANGTPYGRTSVFLYQGGEWKPDAGFAEWMPYQKGQAAKTEALEAKILKDAAAAE